MKMQKRGRHLVLSFISPKTLFSLDFSLKTMLLLTFHLIMCRTLCWIFEVIKSLVRYKSCPSVQFSSVQSLSHVWVFATPWTAARQASLSITNSRSPPKPMSIELVMPSNHLILCHILLLLSSIFPRIRVFSNESALHNNSCP